MPWGIKRYQEARCLHFVTFSCYARAPRLATPHARDVFEKTFEDTRQWYGFYIAGYVVMPEHVHLDLWPIFPVPTYLSKSWVPHFSRSLREVGPLT
jgi:REP element-mobilizing transposase RayT